MTCLSPSRRARITANIIKKEAQLELLEEAYTRALGSADISSYKFDSGEGSQQAAMRDPSKLLKDIQTLESEVNRLYRQLEGGGIVNMNLRRRRPIRW